MIDTLAEKILNKLKVMDARLDSIEKMTNFINTEREIMEDIRTSFVAFKELLLNQRQHFDNKVNDVKAEVQIQGIKTDDKLEDTKDKIKEVKDAIKR